MVGPGLLGSGPTPWRVAPEGQAPVGYRLAVQVVEHIRREHADDTEIRFGPDMFLGA